MAVVKKRNNREPRPSAPANPAALTRVRAALSQMTRDREEALTAAIAGLDGVPRVVVAEALDELARDNPQNALPLLVHLADRWPMPLAMAAVEALGSVRAPDSVAALRRLASEAADKDLRKAAKKSLFRLQTAGVALPEAPAQASRPQAHQTLVARISNPDGSGSRFLILANEAPLGSADLLAVVVNDEQGLLEGRGTHVSRSDLARRVEQLFHPIEGLHLVDAPGDYLRQVLQQAHECNRVTGKPVPDEYYRWSGSIGTPERHYERELMFDEADSAVIRWNPQLLDDSGALFHLPEFSGWLMPPEAAQEAARKAARARESRLVLPGQIEERQELRVVERLAEGFFDEAQRLKYKRRLEQAAYVLAKLGHVLAARRALAASMALDPASRLPVSRQPFAVEMALRTLQYMQAEAEQHRSRSGGLVLPG